MTPYQARRTFLGTYLDRIVGNHFVIEQFQQRVEAVNEKKG